MKRMTKKAIVNWFGERGIQVESSWIKKHKVVDGMLFYQLSIPGKWDGVDIYSTDPGKIDITCLNSSCFELYDETTDAKFERLTP